MRLPGQDVAAALFDIEQAAALEPQHLSWYQLTLEPNTVFHARPPAGLPDEDTCFDIQRRGEQPGWPSWAIEQYEVSAYARSGRRAGTISTTGRSVTTWRSGPVRTARSRHAAGIWRYAKPANPLQYMEHMEQGGDAAAQKLG